MNNQELDSRTMETAESSGCTAGILPVKQNVDFSSDSRRKAWGTAMAPMALRLYRST